MKVTNLLIEVPSFLIKTFCKEKIVKEEEFLYGNNECVITYVWGANISLYGDLALLGI